MRLSLKLARRLSHVSKRNCEMLKPNKGRSTQEGSRQSVSGLEELALLQIHLAGLPSPQREYVFSTERKFRFDFAWVDRKLGLECHGSTWKNGRHNRGAGFAQDRFKMNLAQLEGWKVIEATAEQIKSGEAIKWVERALAG